MAGKEAILFLVDCNQSMSGSNIELAQQAVRALMVQKMLQSKTNELGVVLFGLPKEETNNSMNIVNDDEYHGISELCRLEKGSAQMLRKLREIGVPELANPGDAKGDILDAMVVGINAMKDRTLKRQYLRHVYILSDCVTPVVGVDQLADVVEMYTFPSMSCKLHVVGFGSRVKTEGEAGAPEQDRMIKEQNEKMLASVAAVTGGSVLFASNVVDVMGAASVKTVNPTLTKIDLCVGTNLAIHCRYFKKTDTSLNESLKKEPRPTSVAQNVVGGSSDVDAGKVRTDRIYRNPETPDVEIDFDCRVRGYRYGQDYIPVNTLDADSLKLPPEPAAIKTLGFVANTAVPRHYYMSDTFVVVPEPGSAQCAGAISSLVAALRKLEQVAVVRFVRPSSGRSGSEPWFGVLIPDTSGVSQQARFIFQKLPFSEDLRDYTFPSFEKPPTSRRPSDEQVAVSASLVDAMMMPEEAEEERRGIRTGLVLNPVKQLINQLKIARALDPDCNVPDLHPSVKAGVCPDPKLLEKAAPVLKKYADTFQFEKQDRKKAGTDKKRVMYFSDLTLADPEAGDGEAANCPSKRSRPDDADSSVGGSEGGAIGSDGASASSTAVAGGGGISVDVPSKVGSINPVSDFEKMMSASRDADGGGAVLADRAVEEMQGVIRTLVRKGTTTALRTKAVGCLKALRRASVGHFMGKHYNDFLADMKGKYQQGDHSDLWQMMQQEKDVWPVTHEEDSSLDMTLEAAAAFMKTEQFKEEEGEADVYDAEDDDLDDMA